MKLVGIILLFALSFAECRGYYFPAGTDEKKKVDIRGSVVDIKRPHGEAVDQKVIAAVMVEGVKEADTGYDKANIKVTTETKIFVREGEGRRPVAFERLKVGDRVEARFTGPALMSYPIQAAASEITILKK
jgi:hypothetical protein